MRIIHFSAAINQLHQLINQVATDCDVTFISCESGEVAVLMPERTYNSIMETLHLFKSSANSDHLRRSLVQYRKC